MENNTRTDNTAKRIYDHWQRGDVIHYAPSADWPQTAEEGYAAQAALAALHKQPVKGWKIAATAIAGRTHINVDRPLAGRLFADMCHPNHSTLDMSHNRMAVAEAEFVFVLGRDLSPQESPYTPVEVSAAIASVQAGLELPDSRFENFTQPGTAGLLADNACAAHFILGDEQVDVTTENIDTAALATHPTALYINESLACSGTGHDALDGPLNALVWLANTLSDLGITLAAGQFVTTGVTGKPMPIQPGDTVRADLGRFGSASVTLAS